MEARLRSEFQRVFKGKKKESALVLDEIIQMKLGENAQEVDLTHLGTLFVIDKSREGKFSWREVSEFARLYFEKSQNNNSSDFQVPFI